MLRSFLRPTFLAFAASLVLSGPACGKEGSTNTPGAQGKDKAAIEKERAEAAEKAKAMGLVDLANKDLESGRFVSARKRAEEALETNPSDPDAYAILGAAAWRSGDYEASTAAYKKALEFDATNFGAIDGLGRNLQAAGDHAEAMRLQDALIAVEGKDFSPAACDADTECEVGWCDSQAKQCKPSMQARPRMTKLWSQYLLLDADAGVKGADEIFVGSGASADELAIVTPHAEFLRPLVGKGPFIEIDGASGSSDLDIDVASGFKHFSATAGGEYARTIMMEALNETRIDAALADTLKLEELGKVKPLGMVDEMAIVLVPEIKIGELTLKNVPALKTDLSVFGAIGETPGLVLGRQVMHRFGAITFDFPGKTIDITVDTPAMPEGSSELPLLIIDSLALRVPVAPVSIDGSDHKFWAWIGGAWQAGLAVTGKAYLKSGHRPSDIDPPDDPELGLKMVYLEEIALGDVKTPGMGGYVLTNTPPDAMLGQMLENTRFELGGYLNVAALKLHKVTFLLPTGKMWVSKPAK
jgi:tetratricopeptide (TPR) repeat protein